MEGGTGEKKDRLERDGVVGEVVQVPGRHCSGEERKHSIRIGGRPPLVGIDDSRAASCLQGPGEVRSAFKEKGCPSLILSLALTAPLLRHLRTEGVS